MTNTIAPPPPISTARAAAVDARHMRAEHLVAVATGLLAPLDVVEATSADTGKPLRKISLRQLHLSAEGWGETRTRRLLAWLVERSGEKVESSDRLTISWLVDPRLDGRRFLAWLDAQQPKAAAPWPGFPFTSGKQARA